MITGTERSNSEIMQNLFLCLESYGCIIMYSFSCSCV